VRPLPSPTRSGRSPPTSVLRWHRCRAEEEVLPLMRTVAPCDQTVCFDRQGRTFPNSRGGTRVRGSEWMGARIADIPAGVAGMRHRTVEGGDAGAVFWRTGSLASTALLARAPGSQGAACDGRQEWVQTDSTGSQFGSRSTIKNSDLVCDQSGWRDSNPRPPAPKSAPSGRWTWPDAARRGVNLQ
jgi:hypothetical protein